MAAMLDQSLDAMIKETRKATPKRRGAAQKKKQIGGKKKTPMKKKANGGGPTPMAVGGVKKANKKKKPARSKGAMAMAVDVAMGGKGQKKKNGSTAGPTQRTKLVVGNLDFNVNDRDIKVRLGGDYDDDECCRRRAPRGVDAFVVKT